MAAGSSSVEIALVSEALSSVVSSFRSVNREYFELVKELKKDPFQKEVSKSKKAIENQISKAKRAAAAIENLTDEVKILSEEHKRGGKNLREYKRDVMKAGKAAKRAGSIIDTDLSDALDRLSENTDISADDLDAFSAALINAAKKQEDHSEEVAKSLKWQVRATSFFERLDQVSSVPAGLGLFVKGLQEAAGDVKEARGMGIPSFVDDISDIDIAKLGLSMEEGRAIYNENFTLLSAMTKDMKHAADPWIESQRLMTTTMVTLSDGSKEAMHDFFRNVTSTPEEAAKAQMALFDSIRSVDPTSTFEETAASAADLSTALTRSARISRKSVPAQAELFKQYNQSAEVQAALMGMNEEQQEDFKNNHVANIAANQELGKMPEAIMETNKALLATRKSINPLEWRKQMATASVVLSNIGVKNVDRMLTLMRKKRAGIDIGAEGEKQLTEDQTAAKIVIEKERSAAAMGDMGAEVNVMQLERAQGPILDAIEGGALTQTDMARSLNKEQVGAFTKLSDGFKNIGGAIENALSTAEQKITNLFQEFLSDPTWKAIAGIVSAVSSVALSAAGPSLMGAAAALTAAAGAQGMGPALGGAVKKGAGKVAGMGRAAGGAVKKGAGKVAGMGRAAGAVAGRLAPRALSLMGPAGLVGGAGMAGYEVGNLINEYTPIQEWIASGLDKLTGLDSKAGALAPTTEMPKKAYTGMDKLTGLDTSALAPAAPKPPAVKSDDAMREEDNWARERAKKEPETMEKLDAMINNGSLTKEAMAKLVLLLEKTNELLNSQSEFYEDIVDNTKRSKVLGLS